MSADKIKPGEYASAMIEFVDRASGKKTATCYPITRVELYQMNADMSGLEMARKFVVVDDKWVEVQ